uniref:Uncharacterized protein n=1 Tax=Terrapene triunguis TaxID=2587831 RepID=A0A674K884_9SAUR
MEKEKPFKLFVPPRLSSGQVSAVKPQIYLNKLIFKFFQVFNKCTEDYFSLPFVMTSTPSHGEVTDPGKAKKGITSSCTIETKVQSLNDREGLWQRRELNSGLQSPRLVP